MVVSERKLETWSQSGFSPHLSGNEKVSGHCICHLGVDCASSSICGWQDDRQEERRTTARQGCGAVQVIASWLARSIILTGQSHNTTTCTPQTPSLLPMNLSPGPISRHRPLPLLLSLSIAHNSGKAKNWISLCQSDGCVLKEAKVTFKPLNFLAYCTRQQTQNREILGCSEHRCWKSAA